MPRRPNTMPYSIMLFALVLCVLSTLQAVRFWGRAPFFFFAVLAAVSGAFCLIWAAAGIVWALG